MMSRSASLLACVALVLAGVAPAGAAHPGGCGGSWGPSSRSCDFGLEGVPVEIYGDAQTTSGTASVHVWVTITLTTGPQTILECRASGTRFASCEAEISVPVGEVDAYTGLLPLRCRVEGVGSGRYGCSTPGRPA